MPCCRSLASLLLAATLLPCLQAQVPLRNAADLQKQLDRLQTVGSVLYIACLLYTSPSPRD